MKIIGINAFHGDSSACLISDGKIISAVEEERFARIKHWVGFPKKSIEFCLNNSNLKLILEKVKNRKQWSGNNLEKWLSINKLEYN